MARRLTTSEMAMFSARSDLRNLSRAGVAENSSCTSTRVPGLRAAGRTVCLVPRSTTISRADGASRCRDAMARCATEPIDGSASPRKPERGDVEQVLVGELGGGVPLHRQRQIGRAHAGAVVGHTDQRQTAGRRHHLDVGGPGIERVLDELLHHAGGPFDHLAGGDAVDGRRAQLANGHLRPVDLRSGVRPLTSTSALNMHAIRQGSDPFTTASPSAGPPRARA